jgi:hypothetical protein
MILTRLSRPEVARAVAVLGARLAARDRRVLRRIARPAWHERARGAAAERHRQEALVLAARFGMGVRPGPPRRDVSWNGRARRAGPQAYVLLHEVAHFQLAAPARRRRIDFGLGPGPETGDRAAAERVARLGGVGREREEAMASLLGILWEAQLGHPALASFLDQNWLDSYDRPAAAAHFAGVVAALRRVRLLDGADRPVPSLAAAYAARRSGQAAARSGEVHVDGQAALERRRLASREHPAPAGLGLVRRLLAGHAPGVLPLVSRPQPEF